MDATQKFNSFRVENAACFIRFPELHSGLFILHPFGIFRFLLYYNIRNAPIVPVRLNLVLYTRTKVVCWLFQSRGFIGIIPPRVRDFVPINRGFRLKKHSTKAQQHKFSNHLLNEVKSRFRDWAV